jgi:DNA-binding NarL/FixJ family response regulator
LAAIQAGAIGYLIKDCTPQELFSAIHYAYLGKPVLNSRTELSLLEQIKQKRSIDQPIETLTERELEKLSLLAQGLSNIEIAQRTGITEGTVRSHVSNLLNKLGLANRAQAVIYAVRKDFINLDLGTN